MSYLEEPLLGENKGETKEVFLTPKVYIRVGAVFFFFSVAYSFEILLW